MNEVEKVDKVLMKKKPKSYYYEAERQLHLEADMKSYVEGLIDELYEIDKLLLRYGELLNRSQRLFTPRLCLIKYANYNVNGKLDRVPLWVWQNKMETSEGNKWFITRVNNPERFDPRSSFKLKNRSRVMGVNKAALETLLVKANNLLKYRKALLEEHRKFIGSFRKGRKSRANKLMYYMGHLDRIEGRLKNKLPERAKARFDGLEIEPTDVKATVEPVIQSVVDDIVVDDDLLADYDLGDEDVGIDLADDDFDLSDDDFE